eukprot:TRINITY_DN569_c2_g1_i1.p1 TRINITY_DN569_c2_g1~~TRINITY_DN569_c2_g1_i1.p1  ORF type:complete len:1535 (+),score=310.23 TRINITY_DN569_c2_g1_i1:46-4605(+)
MAAEVDCSKEAVTRQLRVLDSTSASAQERVRAIDSLSTIGKARTRELPDPIPLVICLRWLLTSRNVWTRVAALRVVKSFAHDKGFLTCCWEHNLNWFVARSMDRSSDREKRVEKERTQAYKLVQRCVELLASQHKADVETYENYPERETSQAARSSIHQGSSIHHTGTSILSMSPLSSSMLTASPFGRSIDSSAAFSVPLQQDTLTKSPQHLRPGERCQSHDASSGSGSSHQTDLHYPDLPRGIVQRLATTADNKEDAFNKKAIPLLRDLLLYSPSSLSNANAVKSLVNVLCNPDQVEHHSGIVWAIVYCLDNPESRAHLRVQLDIQQIFAPFAEKVGKDTADLKKRLKCARDNILLLLRSWAGLFFLASNPAGLRALVDTLRMPGATFRKMIVFEIIHLAIKAASPLRGIPQTGPWTDYGEASQPKDGYRASGHHFCGEDETSSQTSNTSTRLTSDDRRHATVSACVGYSCLDVFLGSMLLVLEQAGLHKALMGLVRASMDSDISVTTTESKGDSQSNQPVLISQAAAHLLQTSLLLSDSLFPSEFSERLYNSFDRVIADMLVTGKGLPGLHTASKVRSMTTSLFHKIAYGSAAPKKAVRLDSIKLQMSSNMEDAQFRILLNDSQVTTTKDWNKWNCETALFLIKGPLRLHTRLQETLKTKFFKRFLTFIKPRRRLFSELPYKEENLVYSTVACGLIDLLLQSKEGGLYLSQSGLLEEIRAILNEVNDVATATAEREKVLCKERVMYFMARDYFKMIGKCSESPLGVELLTQHKIFKSLQVLMEKSKTRDRDDVCHQILKHLNFGRFGSSTVTPEAKQIFANAMAEGSRPIRLFATLQLRNSFRFGYRDSVDWALLLLVAQLSDSWREVAKAAHEIINEWCMLNDTVLDRFINERPGMNIFTKKDEAEEHTQKLLLRMLTRDAGFNYLHELGVVQVQLQEWRSHKEVEWVVALERNLSAALFQVQKPDYCSSASLPKRRGRMMETSVNQNTVIYPPHFFGELAKTIPGTTFLKDHNVLQDQQDIILAAMEESDRLQFQSQETSCSGNQQSSSLDIPSRRIGSTNFEDAMMHSVSAWVHEEEDIIKDLPGEQRSSSTTPNRTEKPSERVAKRSPATASIQHSDPKVLGLESPKSSPRADKVRQRSTFSLNIESVDYTSKQPEQPVLKVRNSVQLRAALWSVAFMASSETGFEFIESQPAGLMLIQIIVNMTMSADTLSLRGTLMSIVSVIGQSKAGAAHLRKLGWVTSHGEGYNTNDGAWCGCSFTHPIDYDSWKEISYKPFNKKPCQLVYPDNIAKEKEAAEAALSPFGVTASTAPDHFKDINTLCQQAVSKGIGTHKEVMKYFGILLACHHRDRSAAAKKKDSKERCAYDVVLHNVETMANPVMIDTSSKALKRVKAQDVSIFHDPYLAFAMHDVLNTYSFRATTRKYLYDTFVDHAIYCHEAFAYLDASLYPSQTIVPPAVDPPTGQLENHSFNGSNTSTRSSPVPRPVSPALSKPYERVSPIALTKMSPPTTPRR